MLHGRLGGRCHHLCHSLAHGHHHSLVAPRSSAKPRAGLGDHTGTVDLPSMPASPPPPRRRRRRLQLPLRCSSTSSPDAPSAPPTDANNNACLCGPARAGAACSVRPLPPPVPPANELAQAIASRRLRLSPPAGSRRRRRPRRHLPPPSPKVPSPTPSPPPPPPPLPPFTGFFTMATSLTLTMPRRFARAWPLCPSFSAQSKTRPSLTLRLAMSGCGLASPNPQGPRTKPDGSGSITSPCCCPPMAFPRPTPPFPTMSPMVPNPPGSVACGSTIASGMTAFAPLPQSGALCACMHRRLHRRFPTRRPRPAASGTAAVAAAAARAQHSGSA